MFSRLRFHPLLLLFLLVTSCLSVTLFPIAPAISQTKVVNAPHAIAQTSITQETDIKQPTSKAAEPTPVLTKGVKKTVLDNGLVVLTKEVTTAPVVSVQVWYRVGSRNEAPGVNGIAHQLEHLMFKGTQDRPIQFGRLFSALGSDSNAFTSYDMTAYFGTVEQDKLEALLALEADRMRNAIISKEELTTEKRVVISELQGYENNPGYRLGRAVMRAAFPDSPYGLPVGGTKADVEKFTVDQVRYYYDAYYRPDNAALVITGNFKTDELIPLIQNTFGQIEQPAIAKPADPKPTKGNPTTVQKATTQAPIILREPGSASLLSAVYPLPDVSHPDVPALQLMDYILSNGRSSRIYQALVESGLASDASGFAAHLISGGWYEFSATAAPGKDLQDVDRVLQQTVTELQEKGITPEELNRAKAQLRASILLRNRDISSQAMQLGDDYISTGDYQFTDRLLAAIATVSPPDIQRVAQTYLQPQNRTVGLFEPTTLDATAAANSGSPSHTGDQFKPGTPVDPNEVAQYLPSLKTNSSAESAQVLPEKVTLKNGLQVLLLRDRSTPTITLSGYVAAGSAYDPSETGGLASLTADNLLNGTQTRDALTIAKTLENKGANLQFGASREGVSITGEALSADLPTLIQVLGDVLQNSTFPEKEIELSRQQALTALKIELDNPSRVARREFQQAVYPKNHPFYTLPTEASLTSITRSDLLNFYKQQYTPETTMLALVGDFDPAQVRSLLARELEGWKSSGNSVKLRFPPVPLPEKIVRLNPLLPGKTQSITFMGYSAINRQDPQFYAAQILNQILGGDTLASRLGSEIRDRQGLTYGIYSMFQAGKASGPFLIYMQTAPEDANRAISSTLTLLQQIRQQGLTSAEINAAKRSLSSNYSVELASPVNLANHILMNTVYELGLDEIRQYRAKIQAVTPQQMQQAIQQLLHPNNLVIVTAGPPTTAKP